MRCDIPLIAIFTSHVLAGELATGGGHLNGLEKRQVSNFCGTDSYGNNYFCIDSACCVGGSAWSCAGANDQCCTTGYTCPNNSQCYLDQLNDQLCVSGSTTQSASPGQPASTSASGSSPTTSPSSSPSTSPSTSPISGAQTARKTGYVFAALMSLAIPAVLLG